MTVMAHERRVSGSDAAPIATTIASDEYALVDRDLTPVTNDEANLLDLFNEREPVRNHSEITKKDYQEMSKEHRVKNSIQW